MNHGESLLRAILADPASDAARLVYADWLEENGETTRAEFIRVQIEVATSPPGRPLVWLTDHRVEMRNPRREEESYTNAPLEVFYDPAPSWQITGYMAEEDVRSLPQPDAHAPIGTLVSQRPLVDVVLPNAASRIFACHFVRLHLTRRGDGRVRAEFVQLPQYDPDTGEISYPLPCAVRAKHESLRRRERELFDSVMPSWDVFPGRGRAGLAHRGFVATVALTTANFLAHAATLFAAQPITYVRLVDRHPPEESTGWVRWHGSDGENLRWASRLPMVVYDRLTGEHLRYDYRPDFDPNVYYPSAAEAHAALSRACVAYGRSLVGLPPL